MKRKFAISYQLSAISQQGQAIIIILLIMLVALSVGLALTQRSVTDVSTATQTEQSSRAFSAAEAGIEKALASPYPLGSILPLGNNSSATVDSSGLLPYAAAAIAGIEYPPIGRETTAQFWFVDPSSAPTSAPPASYLGTSVNLYYGNAGTTDLPAVEIQFLIEKNNVFYVENYYYDSSSARTTGANKNNFVYTPGSGTTPPSACGAAQTMATGILGSNRTFYCKQVIGPIKDPTNAAVDCTSGASCKLVLARIRFLYINDNQSLAIEPVGPGNRFPPQIQIYNATGTAGQSQKQIQAFRVKDVILPWFDFAIFSTNEIRK